MSEGQPGPLRPSPNAVLGTAGCLYLLLTGGAALWLHSRERLDALPAVALGDHGVLAAAGAGLGTGLLLHLMLSLLSRRLARVRAVEQRIASAVGAQSETGMLVLAMISAAAEELFFRFAMQDSFGLPLAVALYALMNTGPGTWSWLPIAALLGLAFGTLMATGLGLLSATVAHAIATYLTLRRILP